ncbi:hypothetical protein SAMD00019534_039640 [Acytostelium subglobosum LB1]|uniref:hypothetical protein n=1 Tax=Acytostelium subglobosum LB1 TaxID=1410327 RepID=UPI000644B374|nr:hypothetical protein SAMD00019534_039640 [Acytostelium subglobosum LB1]GAM20789.1 hypothetical protein SAMD00019534_039640 [Acytostelium subglobosum LB1]|eukprot:XP_012755923.1 hypothetical protein SAMD00019534_039640 [Acytostelium subglobosum LB1]
MSSRIDNSRGDGNSRSDNSRGGLVPPSQQHSHSPSNSGSLSPMRGQGNNNSTGGSSSTTPLSVPTIDLIVTPLVKNRVEIDFTTKASKEGIFSMWTSTADKKILYPGDLTIKLEMTSDIPAGTVATKTALSAPVSTSNEDLLQLFENMHHCLFYPLLATGSYRRDVVKTQDTYFVQMIRDNPSRVKKILQSLNEVFAFYLSLAQRESESDPKGFGLLAQALERFIEDTLTNLRDASEYSCTYLQRQFNNHLTEQFKKDNYNDSKVFNDSTQKFGHILSMAVEAVETDEKSGIIRQALRLDAYQEKIAYLRAKALASKEFFNQQMKCRKMNIESHPFYGRACFKNDPNFQSWRKFEESTLTKISSQNQPQEDYMKSVWGIKSKEKDSIGVIAIKVVQARDLIQKEGNSKPSPFVEVEFGGEKKRTKKASGLNPVFKEHFCFHITKLNMNSAELEFNLWDNREKDHFFGKYKFTAKELMQFHKREVSWYPLQKRSSRSKVSGDIRLQFHYLPFPEVTASYPNHTVYYRILLERLMSQELGVASADQLSIIPGSSSVQTTPTKKKRAILDASKTSMLSTQSTMLLKEYADRYGILDQTTKLAMLDYLSKLIIRDSYLECIVELRGILKHVIEMKFSEIGLTIAEEASLKAIVENLALTFKMWLSNFHSVFPLNTPPGSLRMLIDIYYMFRSSELYTLPALPDLIRELYERRYQTAVSMADAMIKKLPNPAGKAALLVRVCDILMFNMDIDQKHFSKDFPSECNILVISIEVYTSLIAIEIDDLTGKGASNPQELVEFLELYFKLKETMSKFSGIFPKMVLLPIPILFKQCVLQWILHSAGQLKDLVDRLCANEKWDPVSDDTLHSASVGELLVGCYHALDVIKSLRWEDLQKMHHAEGQHSLFEIFSNFTMVLSETIIYYTNVIRDLSLKAWDTAADDIFKLSDQYSPELVQTVQRVSLRFNNIQACLGHTEDLISVLLRMMDNYKLSPSIVNAMAKHSYQAINGNVRKLVDRIYDRLAPVLVSEVYRIVDIDPEDKSKNVVVDFFHMLGENLDFNTQVEEPISVLLTPLLHYIASKLQLFSQYLYYPLTKQLLKRLWAGIINILDEMIFPSKKRDFELSLKQLDLIDGMVKTFGEFFFVDGDGLSQKAIDKQSERFVVILTAYREAVRSGVRDFDPLGLKNALKNINFAILKPDLTYLKKLNINLKDLPKQLDIFSLIKTSIEKRQKEREERAAQNKNRPRRATLAMNRLTSLLQIKRYNQQPAATDNGNGSSTSS